MSIIIKSTEEVRRMRAAGKLTRNVLEKAAKLIRPGISTLEIDKSVDEFIRSGGGASALLKYKGFPRSACVSVNEELLHGIGTNLRKLKSGDIVTIDITVRLDGYHGDAARTFLVGDVDEEIVRLVRATEAGFSECVRFAKAGGHLNDICKTIERSATNAGFSTPKEYCGHGIGKDIHEDPSIPCRKMHGRGALLSRNMCLAIEPMFCLGHPDMYIRPDKWTVASRDGKQCAHHENTVLITDGEPDILTL